MYVDDADTWVGSILDEVETVRNVIVELPCKAQKWSDIDDAVFQVVAYDKSAVSLLGHIDSKGIMMIDYGSKYEIELQYYQEAKTKIKYATPSGPNAGLGCRQPLDRKQEHEFKHRLKKESSVPE